jgi:hypothetical protein
VKSMNVVVVVEILFAKRDKTKLTTYSICSYDIDTAPERHSTTN